jgi:hypothetical protein
MAYMAMDRRYCQVDELWEDEQDYFATTELVPPHISWPLGPGFVFVSKATGELWQAAPGEVLDKIDAMVPVPPKSTP